MVERLAQGWSVASVAAAQGVTSKRCTSGVTGTQPKVPLAWPIGHSSDVADEQLRRQRLSGPAIAYRLQRSVSTVGVILRRRGLGRLSALDSRAKIIRYEWEKPGKLIHIDIKKLGRIDGIGHRITGDRTGQSNRRAVGHGLGRE